MKASAHTPDELKELLGKHVCLRHSLIQRVIERDFEGNTSAFGRSLELSDLPHRKTIFRWARQQDGLPKSPERMLALAQALDVDPFLLLEIDTEVMLRCCAAASWNLTWGSVHKALAFLNGLLSLTPDDWPPPDLASWFDGSWYTHEFVHDPGLGRNFFRPFTIKPDLFFGPDGKVEACREPQAWYLAFRDISLKSGEVDPKSWWKPFGMLRLEDGQIHLLHFYGLIEAKPLGSDDYRFIFETHFGQGAAEFRVASLHPFDFEPTDETLSPLAELPRVRFGYPE
ncbi:MAG: hypothetical protein ACAI44_39750 [Candidatus Sericytochromatia bacterium]